MLQSGIFGLSFAFAPKTFGRVLLKEEPHKSREWSKTGVQRQGFGEIRCVVHFPCSADCALSCAITVEGAITVETAIIDGNPFLLFAGDGMANHLGNSLLCGIPVNVG